MKNNLEQLHPREPLLFFLEEALDHKSLIEESDVGMMREFVARLEGAFPWTIAPPLYVDETDYESCTRKEDEPIRTVGGVLELYRLLSPGGERLPKEIQQRQWNECELLVKQLEEFSSKTGWRIGFELSGDAIGYVQDGRRNRSLEQGFFGEWKRMLESES